MITGVGLDLSDIARFEKLVKDTAFTGRVFSFSELEYIRSKGKMAAQSAAGIFCAKEALAKSLGRGISLKFLASCSVSHDENGKPEIALSGGLSDEFCGLRFTLSITHTSDVAAAVVIAEKD